MSRLGWTNLLSVGTAVLIATTATGAAASQASEARFTYEQCDTGLPAGGEPEITFGPDNGGAVQPFDTCAQANGSLYLYQLYRSSAATATLNVAVPATPGGWVEAESLSAGSYRLGPGNERSYVHDEGWPTANAGEETRTFFEHGGLTGGSGNGGFPLVLTCSASYAPGCEAGAGLYVRYIAALEVDPTPPTLGAVTGSLLAPGVRRGRQQLNADAADLGGGVQNLEVLVNNVPATNPEIAPCHVSRISNPSYSGLAATTPSPCPSNLSATWTLDTTAYPFRRGVNIVQVCAEDFATLGQPNQTCTSATSVHVDNSCAASSVAGGETLIVGFPRTKGPKNTVPFGKSTPIEGRLLGPSGAPIAAATVCVAVARGGSHGGYVPTATATTDARGRFEYSLPPGPNRHLRLAYRYDSSQVEQTLTVDTHARPSLTAGPRHLVNGETVTLRGRLPEPSAGGRVVVLQAAVPRAHRWITFRKATTGYHGRFKAGYHFTSTTRKISYRFRAVVPLQAGYPWDQGASKPASVVVTR